MLNVKPNEREFLLKNIPNAEEILAGDDVNAILLPLDQWIAVYGLDSNYELTDKGRIAQRIYDSIYLNA